MTKHFDLLTIGGGSGGVAVSNRAGSYGARCLLIERGRLGGTCVNVGCVPKKVMWNGAQIAGALEDAADYGFRVVIAPSFADIFYNNCFKNGMLPIQLSEEDVERLFQRTAARDAYTLTADLQESMLCDDHGLKLRFHVDPFRRHCLLNGLDDIGLTLEHEDKIAAYEAAHGVGA